MSFHLVHRSQKDPLAADEKAPQHVLLPAAKVHQTHRTGFTVLRSHNMQISPLTVSLKLAFVPAGGGGEEAGGTAQVWSVF